MDRKPDEDFTGADQDPELDVKNDNTENHLYPLYTILAPLTLNRYVAMPHK